MSIVTEGIKNFKNENFKNVKEHYATLENGQSPHTLFITCSDSRVCPQEITQSKAGELFVIRNAGNLIPPFQASGGHSNEACTLEFAIKKLKIKNIVVCGHKSCGAMQGLVSPEKLDSLPILQQELSKYKESFKSEIESCSDLGSLTCLLYTSPSPRDRQKSRMPCSA